jgi:hypothetical protein
MATGDDDGEAQDRVRHARNELRREHRKQHIPWDTYRRKQLHDLKEETRQMALLKRGHESDVKAAEWRSRLDEAEWKRKRSAEDEWVEVMM